jgi:hypothetical protein
MSSRTNVVRIIGFSVLLGRTSNCARVDKGSSSAAVG